MKNIVAVHDAAPPKIISLSVVIDGTFQPVSTDHQSPTALVPGSYVLEWDIAANPADTVKVTLWQQLPDGRWAPYEPPLSIKMPGGRHRMKSRVNPPADYSPYTFDV
jgi:hypothetical protein